MAALSRAAMLATVGLVVAMLSPAAMSDDVPLPEGMSYDYYAESCPSLDNIVHDAVAAAIESDVGVVPGILRIMFHDCFPQGCDASLLLKGDGSELDMPQNGGLRQNALDLIESIRATTHEACGPIVSCADITNLATKQALMQSNVPGYLVPLGRKDTLAPATADQVKILPSPDDRITKLIKTFASRGFDETELVALSGSHTIGRASCGSFANRKGENADFVRQLQRNCTVTFPVAPMQDLDVDTPETFDNKYYTNLQAGKGVLNSDMALTRNATTNAMVNAFAGDEGWFLTTFSNAMRKMAHLDVGPVSIGEVRNNCFRVNTAAQGYSASA